MKTVAGAELDPEGGEALGSEDEASVHHQTHDYERITPGPGAKDGRLGNASNLNRHRDEKKSRQRCRRTAQRRIQALPLANLIGVVHVAPWSSSRDISRAPL
jgi:hypothetical protein